MGPVRQNPIQRTVRSVHMCVHCYLVDINVTWQIHCVFKIYYLTHQLELLHTILHRTVVSDRYVNFKNCR